MATPDQIEVMVDACFTAYQAIRDAGTPEMQAVMRLLLFQIGIELAREAGVDREIGRDPRPEPSE